jgi:two-component system cell cycle sensor histidine kinase/response regulator CckA
VVDDEEIVSETMELMLKKIGHKTQIFNSGHPAVAYYKNNWQNIDLAILDIALPDMSGREIFNELRAINPLVTVIFSSGYSINGEIQKMLKEGARGFIQKPFSVKELETKITDVMQGSDHSDEC